MLVSTARMALSHELRGAALQIVQCSLGGWFGKKRAVNVFGAVGSSSADEHLFADLFPLEHGSRADTELAPHLRGNGDLPLRSDPRLGERHSVHYHGNRTPAFARYGAAVTLNRQPIPDTPNRGPKQLHHNDRPSDHTPLPHPEDPHASGLSPN